MTDADIPAAPRGAAPLEPALCGRKLWTDHSSRRVVDERGGGAGARVNNPYAISDEPAVPDHET